MKTQLTTADVQLDILNENIIRLPPRRYFLKKHSFPSKLSPSWNIFHQLK